jgi:hypothetical protein
MDANMEALLHLVELSRNVAILGEMGNQYSERYLNTTTTTQPFSPKQVGVG